MAALIGMPAKCQFVAKRLSSDDQASLGDLVESYRNNGARGKEAVRLAVVDLLREAEQDLQEVQAAITEQIPAVTKQRTPEGTQTVIPGAEARSAAEARRAAKDAEAEREAEAKRLETKIRKPGQESVRDQEGGLFAAERDQADLLEEDAPAPRTIAWHGTPYDHDKFSTEHIGTGEGAQSFGWGLYFAEKRGVAKFYRDNISYKQIVRDFLDALPEDAESHEVLDLVGTGHFNQYQDRVLKALDADDWLGFDYPSQAVSAAYIELDSFDPSPELVEAVENTGRLYKVSLAPAEDEYLLWDKAMNAQPQGVRDKLRAAATGGVVAKVDDNNFTGHVIYKELAAVLGSDQAASLALNNVGVPGIKFLDQGSRGKGEGSYNYVIFDESLVEIEEKFRDAGLAPSMGWARNEPRIREGLRAILDDIAPNAKLEVVDELIDGKFVGRFRPLEQLISVSLAEQQDNPYKTLRHEAIHFLKEAGVFTDQEWALLSDRARKQWLQEYNIQDRYHSLTREGQIEEAIAEGFANWTNRVDVPPGFRRVVARVMRFLKRVGNHLRGFGIRTIDDVFVSVSKGEVGRRPTRRMDSASETPKYATAQNKLFGESFAVPSTHVREYFQDKNLTLIQRMTAASIEAGRQARVAFQDREYRLKQIQQVIYKARGDIIEEAHDAYLAMEIWMKRAGKKLTDFQQMDLEPLIKKINDYGFDVDVVENYLYARHVVLDKVNEKIAAINPELPDGGSGMMTEEAEGILQAARDDGTFAKLEEIARDYDKIPQGTMKLRLQLGLIDEKTYKIWSDAYPHYVPLRGFAEIDEMDLMLADREKGPRIGKGMSIRGDESKQRLGRKSRAGELIATAVTLRQEAIVRGHKNEALGSLIKLIQANPNPNLWEIDVVDYVAKLNRKTGLVEYGPQTFRALRTDEIAVKVQGKVHYIRFHGDFGATLLRIFSSSGAGTNNIAVQVFARLNRYLAWINTAANPEFILGNWFKDLQTAGINMSQQKIKGLQRRVFMDTPKALIGAYGGLLGQRGTVWEKRYHEFADAGGKVQFFALKDIKAQRDEINSLLKDLDPGNWRTAWIYWKKVLKFIENVNGAVENGVRLSLFHHLVATGVSKKQAASIVSNITVNFNRKGEYGSLINAFFLFYNASIQGSQVVLRALRFKRVRQVVGSIVITTMFLDLINGMMSPEDDDGISKYDKINKWTKHHNLIVANWWDTGSDANPVAVKVPLPYGFNVFSVMGYKLGEMIRGKSNPMEATVDVMAAAWQSFNPLGGEADPLELVIPTVLKPHYELQVNRNFLNNPIKPTGNPFSDAPRPESEKYFKNVTWLSKVFTKWMNEATGGNAIRPGGVDISPESIDHWGNFILGGGGTFVTRGADFVIKALTGEPITYNNVPFARRVLEGENLYYDTGKYRELKSAVHYVEKERKYFSKQKDTEALREIRREYAPEIGMVNTIKSTEKVLRDIRKQRKSVQNRKTLSDSRKKELVEKYDIREKETVRKALKRYRSLLDAAKAQKR